MQACILAMHLLLASIVVRPISTSMVAGDCLGIMDQVCPRLQCWTRSLLICSAWFAVTMTGYPVLIDQHVMQYITI
ncbi:hypothetical protein COO60DRAFT_1476766 [Scenedesmus sp. NREL 46B-D3]|nr:hypothetical protein COO60DRAFT_1476766 [Scenedesmus sp. NREL 46B-D3]